MEEGYKKVFRTASGSEYYSDGKRWIRSKGGEERDSIICIGSIKSGSNRSVHENGRYNIVELIYQLGIENEVPGFEEEFVIGNLPFTLVDCEPGSVIYKNGKFKLKKKINLFRSISLGSEIIELYET